MTTEVTLNPSVTNVTVSSTDALSVDLTTNTTTVELANGLILPQSLGTGDSPTFTSVTAGSFVIAGADISEAELETIDSVTAGTVAANKAVVVDSNKDISSFRNLTATNLTGTLQTAAQTNITSVGTLTGLTAGQITATAYTGPQTIANYVTDTAIDVTEFATYTGKKIIYTGAASTISLPNVVAADIGKSWTIVNAGTGVLTVDVDASGTAQQVRHAHAGGVNTSTTDRTIAIGGIVEIICIAEDSSGITNSSDKPNYLIYGSGVI